MNRTSPLLIALAMAPAVAALDNSNFLGPQPVPIGAGARALGMGGAFSAVADDATACTWNPAGLTQCERPELAMSGSWNRTDQDNGTQSETSQQRHIDHASAMLPFFAMGCQQVVGVAWQRQYDATYGMDYRVRFDDGTAFTNERNRATNRGGFTSLGLSYAIEPLPGLSLGASINAWADAITGSSSTTSTYIVNSVTDIPSFGIHDEADQTYVNHVRVRSGTNIVVGCFWQASPSLTVAAVFRPTYKLGLDVDQTQHNVSGDGTTSTVLDTEKSTRVSLHVPSSLTAGVAWRHDDLDTISFDATCTRWREYYMVGAFHGTGGRDSPFGPTLKPQDLPDLWTLRLGYEHVAILPRMVLVPRVGAMAQWLPSQAKATSATQTNIYADKDFYVGGSAGLSICQRRVIWDAAVQVQYGNDVGAGQYTAFWSTADLITTTARMGVTVQF